MGLMWELTFQEKSKALECALGPRGKGTEGKAYPMVVLGYQGHLQGQVRAELGYTFLPQLK